MYVAERNGRITANNNEFLLKYFKDVDKVTVYNLEEFVKEVDRTLLGRLSTGTKAGAQKKFWVKANAKALKRIFITKSRNVYQAEYRLQKKQSTTSLEKQKAPIRFSRAKRLIAKAKKNKEARRKM